MTLRLRRPVRRLASAAALLVALAAVTFASTVVAATPVQVGYRDFIAQGGVARPTSDKPQSKLWFTDGRWFAGMFNATTDAYRIHRLDPVSQDWSTGAGLPVLDPRNRSTGDYLWDQASQTLWIASTVTTDATAPFTDDSIKVFRTTYDAATNAYSTVASATIPGTQTTTAAGEGGAVTVTIALDGSGRLWTVWPHSGEIRYSYSDDQGATWSSPAQVPTQAGNPVKTGAITSADIGAVFAMDGRIGILWTDHSDTKITGSQNGFWFTSIADGADPATASEWTAAEKLPSLAGAADAEQADNHINVKVASDGTVYAVGKTGKDTLDCATNRQLPLVPLFRRTPAGTWSAHLVSTVGDCNTRPQVVLSDQLDVVYVVMSSPNGGGAIYVKSAPMNGPEALRFRTADTSVQRGTPFIRSATETKIDDPTSAKQAATGQSGLVVLANNIAPQPRYYLHNHWGLGSSTDSTAPSGSVSIDGGAAGTANADRVVSVAVPATDAGSGLSLVRIANAATVDGSGILSDASARTTAYTTPRTWTLTGDDGSKTVYVQWRDAAGNWSAVHSDSILLDRTGPTGTVRINGGASTTSIGSVTVGTVATDPSGPAQVRLSNSPGVTNGVLTDGTTFSYATSVPWTLTVGNGVKTVYAQWRDTLGNWSSVASDTITLDSPDTTFVAMPPVRVLDTRANNPANIKSFQHGVPQKFQVTGPGRVPSGAVAITGNLTVTGQSKKGFVTLGPTVAANPSTSTINFPLGDTRANGVIVPLDDAGRLEAVYRAVAGASTHLILDVTGYFVESVDEAHYFPVDPARVLDTRVSNPSGAKILQPSVPYTFQVTGRTIGSTTIPSDAVGVTGNLTVTGQTRRGYLSLTPSPTANPTTSTLNFPVGESRANNVVVQLGSGGKLSVVYKGTGQAHALLDVTGYFRDHPSGLTYVPLAPARIIDTRIAFGISSALRDDLPRTAVIRRAGGIEPSADAFTGNLTVVGQTRPGYVSVTPTATANPTTSTINFPLGDTRANGFAGMIDPATGRSAFVFKASSGQVHIVVDVTGYFH